MTKLSLKNRGERYTMYSAIGVCMVLGLLANLSTLEKHAERAIPIVQGNLNTKTFPGDYNYGIDPEELRCYAAAVYHEARGESEEGRKAVVSVIRNRTASGVYGGNACDVVTHPWAITGVHQNGLHVDNAEYQNIEAEVLEWLVLGMDNPVGEANLYHAVTMKKFPKWANSKNVEFVNIIDNHIFYKETRVKQ